MDVSYRSTRCGAFWQYDLLGRLFHERQIQGDNSVSFHASIGFAEQRQIRTCCDKFLDVGGEEVARQTRTANTSDVDSTFVHETARRTRWRFGNFSQQTTRLIYQCRVGALVWSSKSDHGRYQVLFQCGFRNGRGRATCQV